MIPTTLPNDRLSLERTAFASAPAALEHEWLVTNGLGGFASGSVALANTRRYHGVLVASLRPPVERVLLVAKLDARVTYRDRHFDLTTNEFADGTLAAPGLAHLTSFHLDGTVPVWTWAIEDALLEQRIWMPNGRNTTYVSFTLRRATHPVEIELTPLCTYRDYHAHTQGGWPLEVSPERQGCRILAFAGARPYRLLIDRGSFVSDADWYWRFRHRVEAERGLDAQEDLFRPGRFHSHLSPGETITFAATAESGATELSRTSLVQETRRQQSLLTDVPDDAPSWVRRLTLAADQFLVQRWSDGKPAGTTVIAGYPWFSDWGRDTMIALPGLTLATGRLEEAASILRTFAAHVSQGMLPNRFPDQGEAPEYNTVDATLWYFHAIEAYLGATSDRQLLRDLYPVLCQIVDWHRRGTRYGIQEDPADGLLRAGEPGVQLTWMDAKVGDWVVTPRIGKPVEINALWHFALTRLANWAALLGDARHAADFERAAARAAASFADAFWYAEGGYLYDVIDGAQRDASLRPNQIFAVSLGTDLLSSERARAVVDACSRHLLTPVGLRSLAPNDLRYAGRYLGGPRERDGVYHQGTVWGWLLGPFALAHFRVYGDAKHANELLAGLAAHLDEGCVGTISEIFDAEGPHTPRGCGAQAWSVSETLRAWHTLAQFTARAGQSRIARGMTP